MAIQVRRGNEADFDASKMLPGEWAVSLDTKYVRMCFAPGVVLRMATYEGFEADKAQFQAILAECRSIQSAVQRIQAEVNSKASLVVEYSNNAKTSADKAHSEAERAKIYADNAEAVTGVQIATKERAGLIKGGDNHIAEDGTLMLITTTDSTTQPNSHAGRLKVDEIGGVTEQDSTAGNQLWNADSLIGVASKEYDSFFEIATLTEGTYTIYIEYAGGTAGSTVYFYGDGGTTIKSVTSGTAKMNVTFTAEEASKILTATIFPYSANVGKAYKTVMFNKGDAVLSQEKYTGGQPAPNPSYPMEIENSVVSGVRTHHKNFYKPTKATTTINGVTFTNNGDGTYLVNGTATAQTDCYISAVKLWEHDAGNYILNGCPKGGAFNTYCLYGYNELTYISDSGNGSPEFELNSSRKYGVFIRINSGVTVSNLVFKPMIRKADVADDTYEPYTESSHTFSQPIYLYGMNGVQDIFTAKQTKRKFAKRVFDGSESWVLASESFYASNTFYTDLHDAKKSEYAYNCLCNSYRFANKSHGALGDYECTLYQSYNYPNQNWFYLRDTSCTTAQELKEKLSAKPITVVYELAEETTEALPIVDQIALNSLATYDGITYVEFDSEIQPTFKGEYGTSKVGGYTLESLLTARNNELKQNMVNERLSALEASVVNNI